MATTIKTTDAETREVRRNYATHPVGVAAAASAGHLGLFNTRGHGVGGAGTYALVTGAADGPIPQVTRYLRKTWTTAPTGIANSGFDMTTSPSTGVSTTGAPVVSGGPLTLSVWARTDAATDKTAALQAYFHDAAGAYLSNVNGAPFILNAAAGWVRIDLALTVPAAAATVQVTLDVDAGTLWAAGNTMDATGVLSERVASAGMYLDGAYSPDPDLAPAWAGAAYASESFLTGTFPMHEVTPILVDGYEATREPGNVVHDIINKTYPDVTLRAPGARRGSLRLLFATEADAINAFAAMAYVGDFTITDPDVPGIEMRFVVAEGGLYIGIDDQSRNVWWVEVPFVEIAP